MAQRPNMQRLRELKRLIDERLGVGVPVPPPPQRITLEQARELAVRTAGQDPGTYGRRFRNVPTAFEVMAAENREDHYVITLVFRPQGYFAGTPGRERFFIEEGGAVARRQVVRLPGSAGWRRNPLRHVAIGLLVVVVVALATLLRLL